MSVDGKKIGLALSGGGYRAAAYHIGTLRALYRNGILDKIDVISSVSGGSITAAYYALHKDDFKNFEETFKEKLKKGVLNTSWPLLVLYFVILAVLVFGTPFFLAYCPMAPCCKILTVFGVWIIFLITLFDGQFIILPTNRLIQRQYDKHFFQGKTLADLPKTPVLTINATEVTSNRIFSFSQTKVSGGEFKETLFKKDEIPVAFAVMASSAFPGGISPIKFPTKYMTEERDDAHKPYLIDGGIYDNIGCHKFTEGKSSFKVTYSIVSLAENDKPVYKSYSNSLTLLRRVIDLALNRIDKLQEAKNMYASDNSRQRNAYVVLKWNDKLHDIPQRFLQNAQNGNIPMEVMAMHGFTEKDLKVLKSLPDMEDRKKASALFNQYKERVQDAIGWAELYTKRPDQNTIDRAYSVCTSLFGLSEAKIEALAAFSEWMTEVQCKLYLPNLL